MRTHTRIGIMVSILVMLSSWLAACDGAVPSMETTTGTEGGGESVEVTEDSATTYESTEPEGGEDPTDTVEPSAPTEGAEAPTFTEPGEEPPPTDPPTASGGNGCTHLYFPVSAGATWTYASTNDVVGPYSFMDTITDVRSDGFTVTGEFKDLERTMEWACGSEGLVALQFGGGAAASVTTSSGVMQLVATDVTGVTMPWEMSPGMAWSQSFVISGEANLAPDVPGTAEGYIQQDWEAIAIESVTVPAGTFEALKVNLTTSLDYVVTISDITVPVVFDMTGPVWFAPEVGWVKSVSTGEMMGESFSDTLELTNYFIP